MINADGIDAVPSIGTGSVSLKHIARRAAHAAEREVMLLVLERTEWNRVRAAKLLEISRPGREQLDQGSVSFVGYPPSPRDLRREQRRLPV